MPELSFRSSPPLEEADILSLIVFNQPINELGEGQQASLAQRAGDLASGYLASGLARSIGSALNLNEFEIQAQGENGAGPTVMLGQQVGKNLFTPTAASGNAVTGTPGNNGLGTLSQGFLELANVKVVDEMVNMITSQRAYEANSKAIQTADEMLHISNGLRRM